MKQPLTPDIGLQALKPQSAEFVDLFSHEVIRFHCQRLQLPGPSPTDLRACISRVDAYGA